MYEVLDKDNIKRLLHNKSNRSKACIYYQGYNHEILNRLLEVLMIYMNYIYIQDK